MSTPKNLTRSAFKMKLKPGHADEYKRRHDNIWAELSALLREAGVSDYSIFLDEETNTLFAMQKVDAASSGSQSLGHHPVVKKWWAYMADIMETNPDQSPVAVPLREVFHLN